MKVLPLSSPQIVKWTVVIVIAWIFIELLAPMRMDWFHLPPHWIRPLALLAIGTGVYFLFFYRAEKKSKTWEDHPVIENVSQQGELVNFSTNHFGDVDGIIAEVNGKSFIFHFPPHTAQAIMDIVSPGDRIEVKSGKVNGPTAQGLQLEEIKNLRTGANVIISGIPPFYPDLPGKEVVVSGVEFSLVYDQKERIRGIKMEDKFIELKPHEADRLQSLLKDAHEIAVVGVERDSASGFVNPEHKHIIRVIKITINGITYLMR